MKDAEWYLLWAKDTWRPGALSTWYSGPVGKAIRCSTCHRLIDQSQLPDIPLSEMPLNYPYAGMWQPQNVGLLSRQFLEELGPEVVEQCLVLGRALEPDGKQELKDFVLVTFKHWASLRGNKQSKYHCCEECKRHDYFIYGFPYLVAGHEPTVPVLGEPFNRIVVSRQVLERLSVRTRKKMNCYAIPIKDKPRDGLGDIDM